MEFISSPKCPHRHCSSDNLILFNTSRPSSSAARQTVSGPDLFTSSPPDIPIPCLYPRASYIQQQWGTPTRCCLPIQVVVVFHRSSSMGSSHPVLFFSVFVELSIHRFIAIFWTQYISLYHGHLTIHRSCVNLHPKSFSQAGPNSFLSSVEYITTFLRVTLPGHEADHSNPFSAEVKNERGCNSTPPTFLHGAILMSAPVQPCLYRCTQIYRRTLIIKQTTISIKLIKMIVSCLVVWIRVRIGMRY